MWLANCLSRLGVSRSRFRPETCPLSQGGALTGEATMRRVLILGAAGRDFHNFNVVFRSNPHYQVVAFTATQIPDIANRRYPAELAGERYPEGIPIRPEEEL